MTLRPKFPTDGRPPLFSLHEIEGTYSEVFSKTGQLLSRLNRRWRRRQGISLFFSFGVALVVLWAFIEGNFTIFFISGALTFFSIRLGLVRDQALETEVETILLSHAILERFASSVSVNEKHLLKVDLRSVHQKIEALSGELPSSLRSHRDHWFSIHLPLLEGDLLVFNFWEEVKEGGEEKFGKNIETQHLGREHSVGLYRGFVPEEEQLLECVTSHITAPSESGLKERVEESAKAFESIAEGLVLVWKHSQESREESHKRMSMMELRPFEPSGVFAPMGR